MESLVYTNLNFQDEGSLRAERIAFKKFKPNKCEYCGKTITKWTDKTVDHIVPVVRGGIDAPSNYCIACKECNQEKTNMTAEEYNKFRSITANWNIDLKNTARNIVIENIKENATINWDNITKEKVMEKTIESLKNKVEGEQEKIYISSTKIFKVPICKIVLNPIDASNQKRIKLNNKKVQNTLIEYRSGIVTPLQVFKTKVSNGNYIYILLNNCSKYYTYKNLLDLEEVEVECVEREELTTNTILSIISCVSGKAREDLFKLLLEKNSSNVETIETFEKVTKEEIEEETEVSFQDIDLIRLPISLRHNIKMLNADNKKVKHLINEYNTLKIIKPIRLYNNIPLDNLYVFYAYKYLLKLKKIKVINVRLEDLTKKERSFISSCTF